MSALLGLVVIFADLQENQVRRIEDVQDAAADSRLLVLVQEKDVVCSPNLYQACSYTFLVYKLLRPSPVLYLVPFCYRHSLLPISERPQLREQCG